MRDLVFEALETRDRLAAFAARLYRFGDGLIDPNSMALIELELEQVDQAILEAPNV